MKKRDVSKKEQRRDRIGRERVHDPYKTRLKPPEPTLCPQCGALFHGGRWQWPELKPEDAHEAVCQACHRTNDKYPAGELTISGDFLGKHRDEIVHLTRNVERTENSEHPLHRIMGIEDQGDSLLVTTTDIHLPRRIGQALSDAYKGDFDFNYDPEGYFIRVHWTRND